MLVVKERVVVGRPWEGGALLQVVSMLIVSSSTISNRPL